MPSPIQVLSSALNFIRQVSFHDREEDRCASLTASSYGGGLESLPFTGSPKPTTNNMFFVCDFNLPFCPILGAEGESVSNGTFDDCIGTVTGTLKPKGTSPRVIGILTCSVCLYVPKIEVT